LESKVLILGDGLLGSELQIQSGWDIVSRKLNTLDINSNHQVEKYVKQYDTVVNCVAFTDTYSEDYSTHWNVNFLFPKLLVDLCNIHKTKLVHISTEFVYANNKQIPTEKDQPYPINNYYGKSKALADELIRIYSQEFLICRELHKPNPFPYDRVWRTYTSGDFVNKIAELIVILVKNRAEGIYNVGTGGKGLWELTPNLPIEEPPTEVPTDTRMNLDKLRTFLDSIDYETLF